MAQGAQSDYFVYVANSGENEILVLRMTSANEPPHVVERIDLKRHAPAGGTSTPMALAPDRRFLFVALRTPPLPVVSFAIDSATGRLTEVGSARLPASTPYISIDRSGSYLLSVANPGATLAVSRIGKDGRVADNAHQVLHIGHKLHCVVVDATNCYAYVSSTDDRQIYLYRFDAASGNLEPNDPPSVVLGEGGDPRHMAFSPDGRFLYVTTEAGGRVACFAVDSDTGRLFERPGAGMMPAAFSGHPRTADIHLTPDGRFLYATERVLNRIVAYGVEQASGALTQVGEIETEAEPRSFAIAPDGRFLLVAGEESGKVSAYAIDQTNGRLAKTVEFPAGPKPNWVEFVAPG